MNRVGEMAQQLITIAVFPDKQNTVPSNQIRKLTTAVTLAPGGYNSLCWPPWVPALI